MSTSVRLSDDIVKLAQTQAAVFHRSPPQQIEHWAEMGRVMESALSYETQIKVKLMATRERLESAYQLPGTPEGILRAQHVIWKTSGPVG